LDSLKVTYCNILRTTENGKNYCVHMPDTTIRSFQFTSYFPYAYYHSSPGQHASKYYFKLTGRYNRKQYVSLYSAKGTYIWNLIETRETYQEAYDEPETLDRYFYSIECRSINQIDIQSEGKVIFSAIL
jgi:hypothetical protein